jgi:uncharacterized protein YecT (DUF1311 family)
MHKRISFPYCVIFILLVTPALAQHMNEKDSPCAAVVVTSDAVQCLSKAGVAANAKLNSTYKNISEKLRSEAADVKRLRTAERLWMQYRDANCTAERGLYNGGTAASPAYLACVEAMTRARTKELKTMYGWILAK